MSLVTALFLGLIQGVTEFIPVSSSGHLVIAHDVLGVEQGGLAFDVALHIGTLAALAVFFHKEIMALGRGILGRNDQTRLARLIAVATLPAVIAGILLQNAAESSFRSVRLVALNLIIVALLMIWAERIAAKRRGNKLQAVRSNQVMAVGFAQAAAIVPGVSRSGSTITAGLFAGLDRISATRLSFLMAIPVTFGAVVKVLASGETISHIGAEPMAFSVGILAAFLSGLWAISFLLKYLSKRGLYVFAYYRIFLGLVILLASA